MELQIFLCDIIYEQSLIIMAQFLNFIKSTNFINKILIFHALLTFFVSILFELFFYSPLIVKTGNKSLKIFLKFSKKKFFFSSKLFLFSIDGAWGIFVVFFCLHIFCLHVLFDYPRNIVGILQLWQKFKKKKIEQSVYWCGKWRKWEEIFFCGISWNFQEI